MKLVLYEWKKLWKNASVLKIVLFFAVLSSIVFFGEITKDKDWTPKYLEIHQKIDVMDVGAAKAWVEQEKERLNNQEDMEYDRASYKSLECIAQEIEALEEYESYRETIQNRYEQSQSISIFADADEGKNAYMGKIASKYKNLSVKAPMKLQPYEGVQRMLESYAGDVLAIVLLLYLVSVVFIQEEKNGKMSFARTMVRGNRKLFLAKVVTTAGSMILYLLGIFLLNLMIVHLVYGTISFSAAVQSVPGLYAVPYAWTIGQYLFFYCCMKSIAIVFLVAVAVLLAKWLVSEVQLSALIALFMGASIWAGSSFYGSGISSVLRIWNVWSMLRGKSIIRNYELICLGNGMLEAAWGIAVMLVVAVACIGFAGFYPWKGRKRRNRMWERKEKKPHGVLFYEMKKMWIYQGGIFLFVACILIQSTVVWRYHKYTGRDEFYYQQYIDTLGERITEETDAKILEEETRLQKLEEELATTENDMNAMRLMYELEKRGGFQKYVDRVHALRESPREQILLKDTQYSMLFEYSEVSSMLVILLCVSFAFLIPAVFHKEKDTRVEHLQRTSLHGGRKLWCAKMAALLLYGISFLLVAAGVSVGKVNSTYALKWKAPAQCLQFYWDSGIKGSIRSTFIVGVALQCVVLAATVILLSACAKRVKNQYVMTGILIGGSVVPTVLVPNSPIVQLQWIHDFFFVFTSRSYVLIGIGVIVLSVSCWIMWKELRR